MTVDVKKLLAHKTGLEPNEQRLFFRGKEKQNEEQLHLGGVKDRSKMLLLEDAAIKERKLEEMRKQSEMIKASQAVAGVREEADKLSERVAALEVAVNGGTKVSEKEFLISTELFMRQLLKLDSIEAEGVAKLQRKAERDDVGVMLVVEAICAGIFNDLVSGSNVDVCVITKGHEDYLIRNHLLPNPRTYVNPKGFTFPKKTEVLSTKLTPLQEVVEVIEGVDAMEE